MSASAQARMPGVLVPAATPKPMVNLLQQEIARIVRSRKVSEKMAARGFDRGGMASEELAAYLRDDTARRKSALTAAKIPQIGA